MPQVKLPSWFVTFWYSKGFQGVLRTFLYVVASAFVSFLLNLLPLIDLNGEWWVVAAGAINVALVAAKKILDARK